MAVITAGLLTATLLTAGPAALEAKEQAEAAPGASEVGRTLEAAAPDTLLPLRYQDDTGRLLLRIAPEAMDRDLLYMNTLAAGLGTTSPLLDRGQIGAEAVVHLKRRGERVLLVRQNVRHRALTEDEAARRAVEESFPRSVLAAFPIEDRDGEVLVVDATDFFLTDVFDVLSRARAAGITGLRIDGDRSYVEPEHTAAFPLNTEVRSVLTYVTDDPHPELRRHAPDGRAVTLEQHHSFVELPELDEEGYRPREFHPRSGIFPNVFFDFDQGFETDYRQRWLVRWRLEPSDPGAYLRGERVEPVEPIVYHIDPAIPEPYRSAFIEGGLWFNEIFEAAGFENAFRIEELPEGADPMDARYNVIHWVHRQERGPSVGPSYRDPRTGEILKTVVRMDSYRSLVNYDLWRGFLPAAGPEGPEMDAETFTMARRKQHSAHEIGHTLGLAHNFIAATQNRASVMDYPVPLVRPDGEGGIDLSEAYRPSGGAHDTLAIRYAYTWYPDAESEAEGLEEIMRDASERGLRFITGRADSDPEGSHPGATRWVEGSDMLEALERTSEVRRILVDRFDERAVRDGEPMSFLNKRFAHVYLHHRTALEGAIKYLGGMEFTYVLRGEDLEPTRVVPADEQRRALRMVLSALEPDELGVPDRVARLIPPTPYGWSPGEELIDSPAGPAVDPLSMAHSLAQEIVDGLLHPERAARLVSFHDWDPELPSLHEVTDALVGATWGAGSPDDALRRVTRRAVLDGLLDLAGDEAATSEVRAAAEAALEDLRERLEDARADSREGRAHLATARRDIDRYFEGRDDPELRPRPEPIQLPWP